jgi:signal transduction histidine kinase/CheY-like chemotaxis protein
MLENRPLFLKQITWFCLFAMIPYMGLWVWEGEFWLMLYGFISAIPLLLNFYFITKKKFALSSLNIFLFGLANIYIYDDGIGGNNGFYFYFFSELLSIFILFENRERRYQTIALLFLLLAVITTNVKGWSPRLYSQFPEMSPDKLRLATINFIMALTCATGEVWFMLKAIRKAEISYIDSIEKANELANTKSEFLSNMSHELRTPMNALIGISEVLIREKPNNSQMKHLEALRFSSYQLLHVINDILDYSRIESGKVELEEIDFDLTKLIQNLQTSLTPIASEKGLDLILVADEGLPQLVRGDANRLTQILNNLINNGIKFTHNGWIRIQVILLKKDDDHVFVKFLVKDTGIGIPADKTELIFERFTQASSETTRKYGGTGLGLAICNKLLQLHGSQIKVVSAVGEGSEFSFELKFGNVNESLNQPNSELESGFDTLTGRHILLAEDNEINQMVAKNVLESWGVHLKIVKNGLEAVNHIDCNPVDLVLMDLQMPEMDGYQASMKIREMHEGKFASLPIIALTASSQFEVGEQYRRSGMNDFLNKPFKPEDLYRKMINCLVA